MRMRLLGACLLCALAIGAASAASAAAAPEFLHSGGPLSVTVFTGKTSTAAELLDPALGIKIHCNSESLEGLIEPGSTTRVEEVLIKFKGCTEQVAAGGKITKCSVRSLGSAIGTIRTKRLAGELFPVPAAEALSEVGLDLKPEIGTVVTAITSGTTCAQPNRIIEGSVISEVTPTGPPETLEKKLVSLAAPGPAQMIQFLPSGLKDTLAIGATEVVLTSNVTLKFAETLEVT